MQLHSDFNNDNGKQLQKIKVLYIAAHPRSGSTLLDRILGQMTGFFSAGELKYIWQRGLRENRLCACGSPFRECAFWTQVGEEAFGGWDQINGEEVIRLQHAVIKHRLIPFIVFPDLWPGYKKRWQEYAQFVVPLYQAILKVSGASIIIDSSKDPAYAFFLSKMVNLNLNVIHLVRDSRGVAFSWTKRVVRPEVTGGTEYMAVYSPIRTALWWIVNNMLFSLVRRTSYTFLRYEDLIHQPCKQLERLLSAIGGEVEHDISFIDNDRVYLKPNHVVSGNPMRFQHGSIRLRLDEGWKENMGRFQKYLMLFTTWPFLLLYGYFNRKGNLSGNNLHGKKTAQYE